MDNFDYFIVFYTLILGLAVTELLGGFARLVRARAVGKLEPQTALLALLTLILVLATWIDARISLLSVTVDFAGLWAPILLAILYYLAAAVVFPHDDADHERLADYYSARKRFVVGMLLAAGIVEHVTYLPVFEGQWARHPAIFWLYLLPYNVAIDGSMIALLFVRSRRANVVMLSVLILLITIPYWDAGLIREVIARHFHYSSAG
ncbi:hypothetical protein [Sphingomonas sp. URHD0057]|uniref:hypothetical protein n=1 Tax=Sphingomonas sp. URHD0057 TaxID=1380389 RepID=UPI00048D643D|nr:hypothetical protein [Sphingomonas sp. URHD0057]